MVNQVRGVGAGGLHTPAAPTGTAASHDSSHEQPNSNSMFHLLCIHGGDAGGSGSTTRSSDSNRDVDYASNTASALSSSAGAGSAVTVHPLTQFRTLQQQQQQPGGDNTATGLVDVVLLMFDPGHLPLTPGWPLRNVLLLAAGRWGVRELKVVCVRDNNKGGMDVDR